MLTVAHRMILVSKQRVRVATLRALLNYERLLKGKSASNSTLVQLVRQKWS